MTMPAYAYPAEPAAPDHPHRIPPAGRSALLPAAPIVFTRHRSRRRRRMRRLRLRILLALGIVPVAYAALAAYGM
ncbi:MAG: hypothetical protein D6754_13685 [Alphaproteobacteria bacterium]|nr:MAG: hypothetical protein D6754_13685 [Alphaproteobacteria bacterium]